MTKARLVLVHGRAQQGKSEAHLIEEWMTPLRETLGAKAGCLDGVEVKAPFYGDRLIELLAELGEPDSDDIIVRGSPLDADEATYRSMLGDYLEAVRRQEGIAEEQLIEEAEIAVRDRGPQNWPWVLAIIRTLNKIPGLDGDMIERVLRDVWIYLERRSVRREIDAIVAPVFDTDLPVVCVAHSLGTVVAYHVLSGRTTGHVPQLLTVGSPLGLKICRQALSPISHPPVVGHWYNARDKRDVVALYPLDGSTFGITPAIDHHDDVRNRTSNAHGISGYMTNAGVAEKVCQALSFIGG